MTEELDAGPIIGPCVTRITHGHDVPDLVRVGAEVLIMDLRGGRSGKQYAVE